MSRRVSIVALVALGLAVPALLGISMSPGVPPHPHEDSVTGGETIGPRILIYDSPDGAQPDMFLGASWPTGALRFMLGGVEEWQMLGSGVGIFRPFSDGDTQIGDGTHVLSKVYARSIVLPGLPLASLVSSGNGTVTYCTDCTVNTAPCTGAGTGAIAKRLNGAWRCD